MMRIFTNRAWSVMAFAAIVLCGATFAGPQQTAPKAKMKAAAVKVLLIESNEISLPAEFQVSLYEDLINELKNKGGLPHVYRDGDRNADGASDLIVLHTTLRGFKEGSEKLRQVTTVAGATSITVHCAFTDKDGKTLLEQDLKGNVRFFGANLRATFDFAKKTAQLTKENFSPTAGR
jgi:hypothetical protein